MVSAFWQTPLAIFLIILFTCTFPKQISAQKSVIINEIMYDFPGGDVNHEWIELYNSGDESVTIIGGTSSGSWRIYDGSNNRTLSMTANQGSMTIDAKGYMIISQNANIFLADNPNFIGNLVESSAMSLVNTTAEIGLRIGSSGTIWSQLSYDNNQGAAGDGNSLQRQPDGTLLATSPTPGAQNATALPSPTPSLSPTIPPASSSTPSSPIFIISNTPSQINSTHTFEVTVNLSLPNSLNTKFYLKGAFKRVDSSNYFGLTKVGSSWVKNGSSYSNQLLITTDSSGNWSGTLQIQPDESDSGFTGTNDYLFKVARYTSSGSGPTWSNEVNMKIVNVSSENLDELQDTESSDSSISFNSSSIIQNPKPNPSPKDYQIASIAGVSKESTGSHVKPKGDQRVNIIPIIAGGVLILLSITSIAYITIKNRLKS